MEFELNNGNKVPNIGYGTWKLTNDEDNANIIKTAIDVGYRHIDTAASYANEEIIGIGIEESHVNRSELFITGKLWNSDRGFENVVSACKRTIKNLKCEYLDLYLMHWPASPAVHENWIEINNDTWRAFEYLYEEGLVKAIGISNFKVSQLEELIKNNKIRPMVNQIEFHPGFMQKETFDYCKQNAILIEAWSPLGSGKLLKKQELKDIAEKYNVSVAKLCIKWCLQNGVVPIPKSTSKDRMIENLNVDDFTILEEDMEVLNNLPYIGGYGFDSETITIFE